MDITEENVASMFAELFVKETIGHAKKLTS